MLRRPLQRRGKPCPARSSKALTKLYDETVKLYGLSFTNPNVRLFAAECTSKLFGTLDKR